MFDFDSQNNAMDIEASPQERELPLFSGEGSLPAPPVNTKGRRKNPEDDDIYLVPIPPWTTREIIIAVLATISAVIGIVLVLLPSFYPIVMITGLLGLTIPPYSALQEQKITDCKAMKETNMVMEREVDNMKLENERLSVENDKLERSVDKIQETKDVLANIQQMNVTCITELESQLKQSQNIYSQMEENHRASVVDNIFDVMLALDADQDFLLSDDEIDTVTKKIELIEGVEIHDELFKQKIIERGRNLDSVMNLLNGLLDDDPNTAPEEQKIIKFQSARTRGW